MGYLMNLLYTVDILKKISLKWIDKNGLIWAYKLSFGHLCLLERTPSFPHTHAHEYTHTQMYVSDTSKCSETKKIAKILCIS